MKPRPAPQARLAVDGGRPVRRRSLPYGHQVVTPRDVAAVTRVLKSDWITTGPLVDKFEKAAADYVGAAHAVTFSSGTAALHGAVFAAGLRAGDEAITTPLTFAATANAVLYQGGTPVFADVAEDTLNLDPAAAEKRVSVRTKAVLPVDYGGHPADLDAFADLARRRNLVVIEDACHALGAALQKRRAGSISHMTVFSFHPVKHITTGEGGMVTTNDAALAARLRLFRSHGINTDFRQREAQGHWFYEMVELGYNYRLPDIACALGLSQLARIRENLAARRKIAARYARELRDLPLRLPSVRAGAEPAWHLYPVRIEPERLRTDRKEIFRALRAEGIGVNVHYVPVYLHPYYRDRFGDRRGLCPVAENAYERLISLPIWHGMTERDASDVIEAVRKVLGAYAR